MELKKKAEELDKQLSIEGLKQNWAVLAVTSIIMFGVWLRYLPAQSMQYLQALDPYYIFRNSQHFATYFSFPTTDFFHYFPYDLPTFRKHIGAAIFPAIFYWMGPFLFFESYMDFAQFYTPMIAGIMILFMYLFGKEIFDKKTGVLSAFFLATIAGVMQRSTAGFFEKDPTGAMFMMISLYFFSRAWIRKERISGIMSGLALGFFTMTWGGAQMLWLLYPLTIASVLFFDNDVESMIISYTPTVLLGSGAAMSLNYANFSLTDPLFLGNMGLLGFLWTRYLVEELSLISDSKLQYYTPTGYGLGLVAMLLSPLYSDFIARQFLRIIDIATQAQSGDVIAGTVAENTAAQVQSLTTQLGATMASGVHPSLGTLAHWVGTWPLAMLGVTIIGTTSMYMFLNKYKLLEKNTITGRNYYSGFMAVFSAWTLLFTGFFIDNLLTTLVAGTAIIAVYIVANYHLDEDFVFKLTSLITGVVLALQIGLLFRPSIVPVATIPVSAFVLSGAGLMYITEKEFTHQIKYNWIYALPFFWAASNILGSVARNRLMFLAAFSTAMIAGYAAARIINAIEIYDFGGQFELVKPERFNIGVIALFVISLLTVNAASGFVAVSQVGESPGQEWEQSLQYLEQETPPGSAVMSWWDYGHHFHAISRRPATADGLNAGYYSQEHRAVNMPLADFFTSQNPEEHFDFLEKHSVDYIVLDNTMIGKYSAVSQISNRDNEQFSSMLTASTNRNIQNSLSESGGSATIEFTSQQGIRLYLPVETEGDSVDISSAPLLDQQGQRTPLDCLVTEEEVIEFDNELETGYCAAVDPFFSIERALALDTQARMILIPRDVVDSTLVRLYIRDGHDLDFVEKVDDASNEYVKVWTVEDLE